MEQTIQDRKLYYFAISNIAQEFLSLQYACDVVEIKNDHLLFIMTGISDEMEQAYSAITAKLQKAQEMVGTLYHVHFSAALSERTEDFKDLNHQYQMAYHNLHYKLIYGENALINPMMVEENMQNHETQLPDELEKTLMESLRANNKELFETTLDKFFALVSSLNYDYMIHMLMYSAILIRNTVNEMSKNRISTSSVDCSHLINEIAAEKPLALIKQRFMNIFEEMNLIHDQKEEVRNEVLIQTIKDIIEENYGDINLCLQEVGDMLKMSAAYVGKLFRTSQGISVAEYINEVRLQHAVQYLEDGSGTIDEIIEQCGFTNRGNFYKLFKKKFGATPREYRFKKTITSNERGHSTDGGNMP